MEKQYYAYLWLREDGTPYYAGKGSGRRAFTSHGHGVHCPKDSSRICVFERSSEAAALETERELISNWGRKDSGTGCLRNLTDGGDGGVNPSQETRRKLSLALVGNRRWLGEPREARQRGGYTQGPITGQKNVESGLIFRIGSRRSRQRGGMTNVENGLFSFQHQSEAGKRGGKVAGRLRAESGAFVQMAGLGGHVRWHVSRGLKSPTCKFCGESNA